MDSLRLVLLLSLTGLLILLSCSSASTASETYSNIDINTGTLVVREGEYLSVEYIDSLKRYGSPFKASKFARHNY